jgi:hypothetical protein
VYQFTCLTHNSPDINEVHRSPQNYGSSKWTLIEVAVNYSKICEPLPQTVNIVQNNVRKTNNSVTKMFSECLKNVNCTLIIFEVLTITEYIVSLGLSSFRSKPKFESAACNGRFATYVECLKSKFTDFPTDELVR